MERGELSKESGWRRGKELPKSREHENRDAIKVDRSMVFKARRTDSRSLSAFDENERERGESLGIIREM